MRYKAFLIVFLTLLVGGTLITGFNVAVDKVDNLEFCVSCHYIRATIYQEYKQSRHYQNRTGVRAECDDCHVPKAFIPLALSKINAAKHIYHHLIGSINTPEKFEAKRLEMAQRVWKSMKETDSRECRSCHNESAMDLSMQKRRAKILHLNAEKNNETCIDCHKGITHKDLHKDLEQEEESEEDFML
ncbi:MAG: Denitrification system component NirT [Methyloprofundus sp.]|nr:Denitrification system component NirT [Methyloprofundus sp.]